MGNSSETRKLSHSAPWVPAFEKFYKTARGQILDEEIARSLAVNWQAEDVKTCHFLTVGFPVPSILSGLEEAKSLSVFLPRLIGPKKVSWKKKNVSVVGDPLHISFFPGSFDAAFVFHGLEFMEDPRSFLEDLWKILSPNGKLMIMVPNRMGGWKGSGVPGQTNIKSFVYKDIQNLLQETGFAPKAFYGICYGLPAGYFRKMLFSKILRVLSGGSLAGFPGFLIFEAEKGSGANKIKIKEAIKIAPGVKTAPEFIPE